MYEASSLVSPVMHESFSKGPRISWAPKKNLNKKNLFKPLQEYKETVQEYLYDFSTKKHEKKKLKQSENETLYYGLWFVENTPIIQQ